MFSGWSNFFTMTGAAGATLVGLLFVVVTLNTGLTTSRKLDIAHASLTPVLDSFGGVLLQSMVALVPWQSNLPSGIIFVVIGIGGLSYRINTARVRRSLHLRAIQSKMDRIMHNLIPIVASVILIYGGLIYGGAELIAGEAFAPFAIAGSTTLLLFSGIYRTWGETLAFIELSDKS
ncbi:hypothetical protein [Synechococcus sp. RedBA-s]|uniref:hypothetical protein n=1 Tax=Synechococcus sp. RedBA-s TaxID=2823741 RepID=UPI0020CC7F30|nr:hypothetical protein [Synechococcus sp. RedBA-s]MCP9800235.1 hypothetical protein [Synechococcus sp. RedBA-s]